MTFRPDPTPSRSTLTGWIAVLLCLTFAGAPTRALVEPDATRFDAIAKSPDWIIEEREELTAADASEAGLAIARLRAQAGATWKGAIDRRTGRALLVQGEGIPVFPGRGNGLKETDVEPDMLDADRHPRMAGLEKFVRGFLADHRALFVPERGDLVLNEGRSAVIEDGRVASVDFDWFVDGVPVEGASVFARLNNGNLTQAGTRLVGHIDTNTRPSLAAHEALDRVFARLGGLDGPDVVQSGRLILLPVSDEPRHFTGSRGTGVSYRLAWEVAFREPGNAPTWTARVDAHSGEVIEFYDANKYAGAVIGGVHPRTVPDGEVLWPFPMTSVSGNGPSATTSLAGLYPAAPAGAGASAMDGRYYDTFCQGCSNPAQPITTSTFGSGLVDFGLGGTNAIGNGMSTPADRNAFYHLNLVRIITRRWLANSWVDSLAFRANVNINESCNAYYDGGSVNFYRSSSTCNNTGEIADVMQHEWGHGLDGHTAGGDGATGEATGDITGMHMTHSPLIGPFFRVDGSPVRNVDKTTTAKGLLTTSNVGSKCGVSPQGGNGPLGREVHCEGEIYGQTQWDLSNLLVARYGTNTGWRESERIYFSALPQSVTYLPFQGGSIYDAYLAADDDDGNPANGTPNADLIYTAFNTHGIAGTAAPTTAHCLRPAQPVLTATPGCDQVSLSWSPVPGATSYTIQKNWQIGPSPFYDVATVGSGVTSYVDTDVSPLLTYHYVVMAVGSSGCESSINAETTTGAIARPRLDLTGLIVDDGPAGNRSGGLDPGEAVDLRLTLRNSGNVAASGISATLSTTTPGITVTAATSAYPSLNPLDSALGVSNYRINIPSNVPCGTPINLTLTSAASGVSCPLETNVIKLETGVRTPVRVSQDFESTTIFALDAVNSTTSIGGWVRGDPVATNYQSGDDVTLNGAMCWYTGSNALGLDDTGDVDSGVTTLLSSAIDLTGLTTARLSYWRWFGQRDLGDDPSGDFFAVDVSNNGGGSWTPVENLGDSVNAPSWVQREVTVENLLPLTANMKFRVRVSDATKAGDAGDIIEGAIDEFKITDLVCDLTPPCFIAPTFAGLAGAASSPGCGEADLSWSAASTSCQNATMSYNVYRSTSPGFTPSPATLIASGVTPLGFHDTGLIVGGTYYYVVRAFDSRSGEELNTVQKTLVSSDTIPPAFGGISYSTTGYQCGETLVSWAAATDCSAPVHYDIYRSTNPSFTPSPANRVADSTGTAYFDAALQAGTNYTYVARARDTMGNSDANLIRVTVPAYGSPGACTGCPAPAPVGKILLSKQGTDVMINWTADPINAARYAVYLMSGPSLTQSIRVGTTPDKIYQHQKGQKISGTSFYFVSAIDLCGQESVLDTEP